MSEIPAASYLVKAKVFLESIQKGVHPVTNQKLPVEDSANNAEVNGAISIGILALDHCLASMARHSANADNFNDDTDRHESQA